jgi:hypothetical protein
MASATPTGQTLDEKYQDERAKHSCLRRMDEFMFCMTLTSQMQTYYHAGTYSDCPKLLARWQTCVRSKISKPEEAEALLQAERKLTLPGKHIFRFRSEYAEQARLRYGVEPAVATPGPAHEDAPKSIS